MALSPTTISKQIKSASPTVNGIDWIKMCEALGLAIYKEIVNPKSVYAQGSTNGVAGAGQILTGKMLFAPIPNMQSFLAAQGVKGVISLQVAAACITGTTAALNTACEYYGTSVGVGIGGDISKVVYANPATFAQSLQSCFVSFGFNGVISKQMAIGVGNGISSILLSGTGVAGVVGSPSPVPSTGTSVCFLR